MTIQCFVFGCKWRDGRHVHIGGERILLQVCPNCKTVRLRSAQ